MSRNDIETQLHVAEHELAQQTAAMNALLTSAVSFYESIRAMSRQQTLQVEALRRAHEDLVQLQQQPPRAE